MAFELIFEQIRIAAALTGCSIAAWQDAKTSFIDERIVYTMASIGAILNLLTLDLSLIAWSFGVAALILAIGLMANRAGYLGSGDVWLFVSLQLLLPYSTQPLIGMRSDNLFTSPGAALLPPILSIFLVSSVFALIGSALIYGVNLVKSGALGKPRLLWPTLMAVAWLPLIYFLPLFGAKQLLFFAALFASGAFLLAFKEEVEERILIKRIPIKEIEDEDILAVEALPSNLVKKHCLRRLLTKREIARLRGIQRIERIRLWPVYKNLPRFAPYIFLALLSNLLLGDFFTWIAS